MYSLVSWTLFLLVNGLALYSAFSFSGYFLRRSLLSCSLPVLSLGIAASGIIYFAHITLVVLFLGVVLKILNIYSVVVTSVLISVLQIYISRNWRKPFLLPLRLSVRQIVRSRDIFLYAIVLLFIAEQRK